MIVYLLLYLEFTNLPVKVQFVFQSYIDLKIGIIYIYIYCKRLNSPVKRLKKDIHFIVLTQLLRIK